MADVAKCWAIIREPDTHLDAIPLHSDSINTCLFKAVDEDIAGDHLIAPDQCLWIIRAQDDNVSCNEDLEEWLLELGVVLDVEDRLANADPVLEGGMVLDGGCMANELYR